MAQVGPQDNWGTGPPPGGPQGAQYTSIMIDTSGDKWPFERFRQISVVLAVIGIIYMACAVLFFAVYLGVGGTNVRVGVLLIFTVFTIGTGGLMIATYKCGRRLSMDHPRLHKYSGLYLLLVTLDVLFTLMMFGYSIKVVDIMEHTIPAESIGSSKVMPIIITINSVAAIAVSMLGLFGSCCRYPVKRVIETPIRVDVQEGR